MLKAFEQLVDKSVLLLRKLRPLARRQGLDLEVANALEELLRSGQLILLLTEDIDLLLRGLTKLLDR